ncbi:MAG TPA: hypothetical protein PKH51_07995, partial [Candidatus Sumerlaeota bacterium]|nr:hypothetical protein [Candidatus Sumerlaeota bacterium]
MKYFSDVLRSLILELRDNPIIRYGAPLRGGFARRTFIFLLLLLPLALGGVQLYARLQSIPIYVPWVPEPWWLTWFHWLHGREWVPCILSVVFFLCFVRDYRRVDQAEQLLLTRMSRGE